MGWVLLQNRWWSERYVSLQIREETLTTSTPTAASATFHRLDCKGVRPPRSGRRAERGAVREGVGARGGVDHTADP